MKVTAALLLSALLLAGCGSKNVKREALAPPVSSKFDVKGHITPKKDINQQAKKPSPIPGLAGLAPINLDPRTLEQPKVYSVSAVNVPVSDLLYRLAVDAKMQLDLSSQVSGNVTINALNQPLEKILQRLAEQVDAYYELSDNTILVRLDRPYWKSYQIDYVNIVKNIKDSSVLTMSVGNVTQSTSGSRAEASKFTMDVSSVHDFWKSLLMDVQAMARINPTLTAGTTPLESAQPVAAAAAETSGAPVQAATNTTAQLQNVVVNKEAGMLSVYTKAKQHRQVADYLETILDRTNKQVLIEATVVEVELSDDYQAGVDWSASRTSGSGATSVSQALLGTNLSSDPNFTVGISQVGSLNIDLGIKMLQQFGDAKVLSSPKIMAMNNQSSLLKVVDNQVYFTVTVNTESATTTSAGVTTFETEVHSVPVGFMMNMTPFISDKGDISLNIRPTLSRIVDYVEDPNPELAKQNISSRIPVIQEREMDSVLRLRNRQTAIIGGLIQDVHSQERVGVPGLSSIPWLGDLFSYRQDVVKKSELIIFIRPVIVHNPDVDHGDLMSFKPFMSTRAN